MRSRGSTGYRDYFRNRIMFPIRNLPGRVVGFAGRVMDNSEPKYLNSMENPIYHKGKILYGLDQTKDDIRKSRTALVVEGYVDHLMLWQSGVTNICAVCGTSLTEDQARLLARYAKRIYIINDGDRAGVRAAVRAADQLVDRRAGYQHCRLAGKRGSRQFHKKRRSRGSPEVDEFCS